MARTISRIAIFALDSVTLLRYCPAITRQVCGMSSRNFASAKYLPSLTSRVICMSPRLTGSQDGVEDDEHLAHDGGYNDLDGLAALAKGGCEAAHDGVVADSHQGGHVEGRTNGGAAGCDVARGA